MLRFLRPRKQSIRIFDSMHRNQRFRKFSKVLQTCEKIFDFFTVANRRFANTKKLGSKYKIINFDIDFNTCIHTQSNTNPVLAITNTNYNFFTYNTFYLKFIITLRANLEGIVIPTPKIMLQSTEHHY